ncbi:hypothetical protein FRC00_003309 [Tulasnella sp. 408]|nr:hypothetical protein FRC00_003309 [Tulasnella sp. 408]
MHKLIVFTTVLASIFSAAYAGSALWGQCGGIAWTGATTCDVGVCTWWNDWFSQCLPATTTSTTSTLTTPEASKPPESTIHLDGSAVLRGTGTGGLPLLVGSTAYILYPGPGCQYKYYLNAYDDSSNPTASYKDMRFENGLIVSTYWTGTPVGVSSASPWGAQSWFLACETPTVDEYLVYLQTGSDVPTGQNCTLTQLKYL